MAKEKEKKEVVLLFTTQEFEVVTEEKEAEGGK